MIFRSFVLSILLGVTSINNIFSQELNERLTLAHQEYDKSNFQSAIDIYSSSIKKSDLSGKHHYNMGNFYFRIGKLGESIYHFKKANELIPRDGDVLYNLNYARSKTKDKIESDDILKVLNIAKVSSFLNENEIYNLFLVVFIILWILYIFKIYLRSDWIFWSTRIFLVGFIFICINLVFDFFTDSSWGVVIKNSTKVQSAIGKNNVTLFTLNEGAEFKITGSIGKDWLQIKFSDDKKGWIKSNNAIY